MVQALDMIITQAVKDRASDIHIEPSEENVRSDTASMASSTTPPACPRVYSRP